MTARNGIDQVQRCAPPARVQGVRVLCVLVCINYPDIRLVGAVRKVHGAVKQFDVRVLSC